MLLTSPLNSWGDDELSVPGMCRCALPAVLCFLKAKLSVLSSCCPMFSQGEVVCVVFVRSRLLVFCQGKLSVLSFLAFESMRTLV